MFNSPVLDLVILLSFTYFVGSLMLSAINESISAGLKTRAKDLKTTFENLLLDPDWTKYVEDTLLKSQHIKSLMNNNDQPPSYIPASNFLYTIIEAINSINYNPASIQNGINNSGLPQTMKNVLTDIWAKAQNNSTAVKSSISVFEEELENFYNNAMDRATGWYKRKTRRIMLVMGFILAALLNIDTVKITNDSLSDKVKLSKTIDSLVANIPNLKSINSGREKHKTDSAKVAEYNQIDSLFNKVSNKISDLKNNYNNIGGYQMGYDNGHYFNDWYVSDKPAPGVGLALKILGLLITAFALQLGSNYWFALLTKAVNLRATGKKPNGKKQS